MSIGTEPICLFCKNYNKNDFDGFTCRAFPDGIPDKIIFTEVDHRKPVKGDNGIQFDPVNKKAEKDAESIINMVS